VALPPARDFNSEEEKYTTMKNKLNLLVVVLIALAAGCVSNNDFLDRENAAVGAGFKTITPNSPAQLARLQQLPVDKVTRVVVAGKPYYILPDVKNNRAYVGGPKQYRAYQQFRHEQIVNAENEPSPSPSVQVVEVNEGWAEWDGWGPLGEPGWY
jgi:hypothetical protein